jgi:aminoglycoside 6'-N-acetyltransferase
MIELRPATIEDLELLRYWDTKQHVIDCDPDSDWNWEVELNRNPEWREQLIAVLQGKPIGMIQIIDPFLEETHYWGSIKKTKEPLISGLERKNILTKVMDLK